MVKIFKGFKNLNKVMLKNFICTVELVNYSNILKQLGNTSTRKVTKVINTYGSKFNVLNKKLNEPTENTIITKTEEMMLELDKLTKSKLILRLITSIETRLEQEKIMSQEKFNVQLLEDKMIDTAAKKHKIDSHKSNGEKIQTIKVSTEKEMKELTIKYQEMDHNEEQQMEKALTEDLEKLSDKEVRDLKNHLDVDKLNSKAIKEVLTKSGGTLTLMMVPSLAGFSSYIALTTIMHAIFTTTLGISLPFAAYSGATSLVSILSGPIGWIGLSGLTVYTLRKNRVKLTQTIMAQIIGITALISETEEEYLSALPDWLSTAQKTKIMNLKEKLDSEQSEVAKLISEKEKIEKDQNEDSKHINSLQGEIKTLNSLIKDQQHKSEDRDRLASILEEKESELKEYEQRTEKSKEFMKEIGFHNQNVKGYVELISQSLMTNNPNDKKEALGETKAMTKFIEYMPSEAFVLAQPVIGEISPDILIIHPENGFRIVEIKNINLSSIDKIESNGSIHIKPWKDRIRTKNPLGQVKKHAEQLFTYLSNNHKDLGDQYRNIGYCVAHLDFTRNDFMEKFESHINQWDARSIEEFFKYHMFADQINSTEIVESVWKARKFNDYMKPLSSEKINEIASSISIDPYFSKDD